MSQGTASLLSVPPIAVNAHSRAHREHELTRLPSEARSRLLILLGRRYGTGSERPAWTRALSLARMRMPRLAATSRGVSRVAAPRRAPSTAWSSRSSRPSWPALVRAVFGSLRSRARHRWGVNRSQGGAVTFVQRFGDALNLNVHFHSLVLDGVYARTPEGLLRFLVLPPPEDAEVARVATRVARRIGRLLERRGLAGGTEPDRLAEEQPLLAACYAASVGGRIATGPRAGQRVRRLGDRIDADDLEALAVMKVPALRPGKFRPPDRLIATLGASTVMRTFDAANP